MNDPSDPSDTSEQSAFVVEDEWSLEDLQELLAHMVEDGLLEAVCPECQQSTPAEGPNCKNCSADVDVNKVQYKLGATYMQGPEFN